MAGSQLQWACPRAFPPWWTFTPTSECLVILNGRLCVPKTCTTCAYALQLADGLVLRLAPGG